MVDERSCCHNGFDYRVAHGDDHHHDPVRETYISRGGAGPTTEEAQAWFHSVHACVPEVHLRPRQVQLRRSWTRRPSSRAASRSAAAHNLSLLLHCSAVAPSHSLKFQCSAVARIRSPNLLFYAAAHNNHSLHSLAVVPRCNRQHHFPAVRNNRRRPCSYVISTLVLDKNVKGHANEDGFELMALQIAFDIVDNDAPFFAAKVMNSIPAPSAVVIDRAPPCHSRCDHRHYTAAKHNRRGQLRPSRHGHRREIRR